MKTWVKHSIFGLGIGLAVGLVFLLAGCTAPVNINVRAEQWQCPAEIHNNDGTVDFKGCEKVDGNSPSEQEAKDGPDTLEVTWLPFSPSLN